jgi:NADH-quinone oxidoreductase subunit N
VLDQLFGFLGFYIPETLSIILMMTLLLLEAGAHGHGPRTKIHIFTQVSLLLVLINLFINLNLPGVHIFYNAVTIDSFSTLVKIIMVIATMGAVYLSHMSSDIYSSLKSEFSIMAVGVLIGGMLLASANNMLTLYLGIETLSILSYVMSSFKRDDAASTEAGMKYALYGGISAGVALFGISHLYGVFGSIQFLDIIDQVPKLQGGQLAISLVSFVLFFVGLGYKISVFPFHMWTPDVYQGSPIPVTTFFSIVPKMAGLAALIRISMVFHVEGSAFTVSYVGLLLVVSAMTMTVGNVTAIGQSSVKRLLAFSSIGHVGMMVLGIAVMDNAGVQAILFYGITYLFMTLVAFMITSVLSDMYGTDTQDVFKGLVYKHPVMAIIMAGVLFSLAGMPPFAGFVAKFNIFSVLLAKKYYGMAIVAAINSVIALYYYMKLAKTMIFGKFEEEGKIQGFNYLNQGIIIVLFLPVIILGVFWEGVMTLAGHATVFLK